jgi:serine phosphatase RsbU (regulator of sigma subunit)
MDTDQEQARGNASWTDASAAPGPEVSASPGENPLRVLLVEDNPGDVRLFRELVRESGGLGFSIEVLGRLAEAVTRLARGDIGLVLLDLSLPDSQGIGTFQRLHTAEPTIPIIVLSGLSNEDVAMQAVHEGAQDYLVKGAGDGQLLVRAMRYAVERSSAARQLGRYAEDLRRKNAQMEADIAMARELQLCFLPQQYPAFPPRAGAASVLRFAHRYRPAAAVGGDFFTVFPVGALTAGLFICDVMGHGLRAALLTAVLRGFMEELKSGAMDPRSFLAGVNRSFHSILRRTDETILATGFYLVADATVGHVRFASAGHPSPIRLVRATGAVQPLRERSTPQGPALGLFADAAYPEMRALFSPGDVIFFFTDGLYEAISSSGEEFGLERLREIIGQRRGQPAEEILDGIIHAAEDFVGHRPFEDDVCLVSLEFVEKPSGEPAVERNSN